MKHSAPVTVASKGPQAGGRRMEALLLRGTNTTKLKSSLSLEKLPFYSFSTTISSRCFLVLVLFHSVQAAVQESLKTRVRIFKLLRSPGIDSKDSSSLCILAGRITTIFVVTACQATKAGGIDSWAP
jgi:hypothetical protein